MTLLNAPEFDEGKEKRKRNLIAATVVFVAAMGLLTVAGFLMGHGWLFINLSAEHRVSVFLSTVQAGDYAKAYGIWMNDPAWQQHPQKYDYTLKRFTEDFTTESDWKGPVTSYKMGCSKRDPTGTAVATTVNGGTGLTLEYQRSDGTLSFFPYELKCGF